MITPSICDLFYSSIPPTVSVNWTATRIRALSYVEQRRPLSSVLRSSCLGQEEQERIRGKRCTKICQAPVRFLSADFGCNLSKDSVYLAGMPFWNPDLLGNLTWDASSIQKQILPWMDLQVAKTRRSKVMWHPKVAWQLLKPSLWPECVSLITTVPEDVWEIQTARVAKYCVCVRLEWKPRGCWAGYWVMGSCETSSASC